MVNWLIGRLGAFLLFTFSQVCNVPVNSPHKFETLPFVLVQLSKVSILFVNTGINIIQKLSQGSSAISEKLDILLIMESATSFCYVTRERDRSSTDLIRKVIFLSGGSFFDNLYIFMRKILAYW